jgi:hypothetical protein
MDFGNAECLSRGVSILSFNFYSELIMVASAKRMEGCLLKNSREFFYLCAERKLKEEARLKAADSP